MVAAAAAAATVMATAVVVTEVAVVTAVVLMVVVVLVVGVVAAAAAAAFANQTLLLLLLLIITFKGAIQDFHNLLTLQNVRSSGQSAVVCKSRATHRTLITCSMSCYVPRGTKGQLSYEV